MRPLTLSRLEALHERLAHHFRHGEEKAYMETADAITSVVFAAAANDSVSKIHAMLLRQLRWSHVADRAPPRRPGRRRWGCRSRSSLDGIALTIFSPAPRASTRTFARRRSTATSRCCSDSPDGGTPFISATPSAS